MKELTKTRRLIIATIIFVLILIVGFITFRKPDFVYVLSPKQALNELYDPSHVVSPDEMQKMTKNNSNKPVLIDLRNPYQFNRGTLDNAINIPVSDILDADVISMFDDYKNKDITVILFGDDQQEANAPWMILSQLGYTNLKVLEGGYHYFAKLKGKGQHDVNPQYQAEEPAMDFAAFVKDMSGGKKIGNISSQPEQIIAIPRQKKSATAGGC